MAGSIDELSPSYVGAQLLKLTPSDTSPARAFAAVDIDVAIDAAADTDGTARRVGLVLPLEMTVTAPSATNFHREIFRRVVPSQITFTPREGGEHLVMLREVGHNKWWGALVVQVAGERTDPRANA